LIGLLHPLHFDGAIVSLLHFNGAIVALLLAVVVAEALGTLTAAAAAAAAAALMPPCGFGAAMLTGALEHLAHSTFFVVTSCEKGCPFSYL
jgi:hypothetical protein